MAQTILTGAALQSNWQTPDLPNSSDNPGPVTGSDAPGTPAPDGSGVRALAAPTDSASAPASAAAVVDAAVEDAAARAAREAEALRHAIGLADTQQHTAGPQVQAVMSRKHARTLRMEIGISSRPPSADDSAPPTAASDSAQPTAASGAPARVATHEPIVAGATHRVGVARDSEANPRTPTRSTDPFGRPPAAGSRRPSPTAPKPAGAQADGGGSNSEPRRVEPPRTFESPPPAAPSLRTQFSDASWQTAVDTNRPRRRSPRMGEQTVVTRRNRTNVRDWLFVGVLVCALGVTASLLLSSYRAPAAQQTPESGGTTVQHAVNTAAQTGENANGANPSPAASGDFTQIVSTPAGAEVVAGGAVIGNTPARVPRTNFDTDYLVRLSGHEPQLVRITSASPATIAITLKPATPAHP